MKVLQVTSEVAPYSKTGGLADVSAGLPAALAARGLKVKVFSPLYCTVREAAPSLTSLKSRPRIPSRFGELDARLFAQHSKPGLSFYFIERDEYFDRKGLYGTPEGDYFDNADRFLFFMRAALQACRLIRFRPDIIHCHDWQTGLIPAMLKSVFWDDPFWRKTRTVFTIHNLAYQGIFPREYMSVSGLPSALFSQEGLEFYGQMNFLKAGIIFSDRFTTVSKRYAHEIQSPEYGHGLDGVLQEHRARLTGILNGVDYSCWNPAVDAHIVQNYTPRDLEGKTKCKGELMSLFGLGGTLKSPILGMVTRLAEQKGLDLLLEAVPRLMRTGIRLVILGQGDEVYARAIRTLGRNYPGKIGVRVGFDPVLAHKIEAGADMFLMPSRFEPCGLNQMYSLKYGTIPIVHAVGGLDDTISAFDPVTGKGNGFKFFSFSAPALLQEVRRALTLFKDQDLWKSLMTNAMRSDFSWKKAARSYHQLYQKTLTADPYRPPQQPR